MGCRYVGQVSANNNADATPAFAALHRAGVAVTAHRYTHDPRAQSYGTEGAEALGLDPARVFKTLMIKVGGELCAALVPVSRSLDLKAAARALGGKKAAMADPQAIERATGYVVGGISPFGQRLDHRTVIDDSVHDWPTVYVSGGRRGLQAELAPADLVSATSAVVDAISR